MRHRRTYRNQDPVKIKARFQSRCAETGELIKKGEPCIYYPTSKKVFHPDSHQAKRFREQQFDNHNVDQEARRIGLI